MEVLKWELVRSWDAGWRISVAAVMTDQTRDEYKVFATPKTAGY